MTAREIAGLTADCIGAACLVLALASLYLPLL